MYLSALNGTVQELKFVRLLVAYEKSVLKNKERRLDVVYLVRQHSDMDPETVTLRENCLHELSLGGAPSPRLSPWSLERH